MCIHFDLYLFNIDMLLKYIVPKWRVNKHVFLRNQKKGNNRIVKYCIKLKNVHKCLMHYGCKVVNCNCYYLENHWLAHSVRNWGFLDQKSSNSDAIHFKKNTLKAFWKEKNVSFVYFNWVPKRKHQYVSPLRIYRSGCINIL